MSATSSIHSLMPVFVDVSFIGDLFALESGLSSLMMLMPMDPKKGKRVQVPELL